MSLVSDTTARLDYRGVFGWPVDDDTGGPRLVTGAGIAAVAVPKALSDQVLHGLRRQGCTAPALSMPTKHGALLVLLAEADMLMADPAAALPRGVRVLTSGETIPLPDERGPDQLTHWIVPPDEHQRWLPSLAAVLTSIRSAHPFPAELGGRWDV